MRVIEVNNLTRLYESSIGTIRKIGITKEALKGVSFFVEKGEVFGLLGPNGAGKSTTIKILTTMLLPSGGNVKVLGEDITRGKKGIREKINFIFGGERNLYWRLSAYDNLKYFSDLYKVDRSVQKNRIPQLLKLVGLEEYSHHRVETFSKGMKQRLQIARGLINDPEILFLDEPTIGLDPSSAIVLRDIIKSLSKKGKTILLTTHYMKEAEELCDRVTILSKGEIVATGKTKKLISSMESSSLEELYLKVIGDEYAS